METITKRNVYSAIATHGGSIAAETLLSIFQSSLKPRGVIDRAVYYQFTSLVEEVAIRHESEHFGRTWILRKPPPRAGCVPVA